MVEVIEERDQHGQGVMERANVAVGLDRLPEGAKIELQEEPPRPLPLVSRPTSMYHGKATAAMTSSPVKGRICQADRNTFRQPLATSR